MSKNNLRGKLITNRLQDMEQRILGVAGEAAEMDSYVKWNIQSKTQLQNMQKIWHTMKRPNIWIIGIEEGEKKQVKDIENIFNKIIDFSVCAFEVFFY